MAPQLSQEGASSWKRANWSLRTAALAPSARSLAAPRSSISAPGFFAVAVEWPLPLAPFEPLAWPLPLPLVLACAPSPGRRDQRSASVPASPGGRGREEPSLALRACVPDSCPLSTAPCPF